MYNISFELKNSNKLKKILKNLGKSIIKNATVTFSSSALGVCIQINTNSGIIKYYEKDSVITKDGIVVFYIDDIIDFIDGSIIKIYIDNSQYYLNNFPITELEKEIVNETNVIGDSFNLSEEDFKSFYKKLKLNKKYLKKSLFKESINMLCILKDDEIEMRIISPLEIITDSIKIKETKQNVFIILDKMNIKMLDNIKNNVTITIGDNYMFSNDDISITIYKNNVNNNLYFPKFKNKNKL